MCVSIFLVGTSLENTIIWYHIIAYEKEREGDQRTTACCGDFQEMVIMSLYNIVSKTMGHVHTNSHM